MTADPIHRFGGAARRAILVIAAWALIAATSPLVSQAQQDERSVRAAFVYSLTKYVNWPVPIHELDICVFGRGATGAALKDVVDSKMTDGRTLHVLLEPSSSELQRCEIFYWSDPDESGVRSVLERAHGLPILTVGESDRFVRQGGMIGFVRVGDSIQIEVNADSVKAAGLKISSRLLNLAFIVHTEKLG